MKVYKISGSVLNDLYRASIDYYNEQHDMPGQGSTFTYSKAFWNGHGSAIAHLRDLVRRWDPDTCSAVQ